jgi:hypothetical protein
MLSSKGGNVQACMMLSSLNVSELNSGIAVAAENGCKPFKINMLVTLGGARWLEKSQLLLDIHQILEIYRKWREWESKHGIHVYLDGPPCFAPIRDTFKSGVGAVGPSPIANTRHSFSLIRGVKKLSKEGFSQRTIWYQAARAEASAHDQTVWWGDIQTKAA